MIIEPIACFIVCNSVNPDTYAVYTDTETVQLFTLFVITIFDGLQLAWIVYKQTDGLSNEVSVEKMPRFCKGIILIENSNDP